MGLHPLSQKRNPFSRPKPAATQEQSRHQSSSKQSKKQRRARKKAETMPSSYWNRKKNRAHKVTSNHKTTTTTKPRNKSKGVPDPQAGDAQEPNRFNKAQSTPRQGAAGFSPRGFQTRETPKQLTTTPYCGHPGAPGVAVSHSHGPVEV
jgi:hypothetical protein